MQNIFKNEQFIKRLKSFAWRISVVAAIAVINEIIKWAGTAGLDSWLVVCIGLVGGELTKFLNARHQANKELTETLDKAE